ncbi:CPBP family intramembrane glutamic endopeptidase [Sanyastnella coralliicola]|uniref:CPBP family intramembrane glutamic endopeptidase n=1 Tax=Sanyastnella coralliicola TaxID=3069118 RepID=UPI0027B9AE57|nr:CPBP family intramembrane glutamic endopeptidase [Longitalea sp. SCSIO 12813]
MSSRANRQRKAFTTMAGLTLLIMPLIAWVIAEFSSEVNLWDRWIGRWPISDQLMIGIPVGIVAALGARFVISRNFMEGVRMRYARMFGNLQLNWSEIIFISVCAGVGEELLFRGAIQPLLGILLTAIFFVAIHGYLNPKDWRISVYGAYMTLVVIGFGYMTEAFGVWSAVMAHTVVDVILLMDVREKKE